MTDSPHDASDRLGQAPVGKLLITFSIPAIIGMLVQALYNVVDRIFIGQGIGSLGIAGIVIGTPVTMVLIGTSMLIGVGANALFAIRMGEGRRDEVEGIMGNALVLLVLLPGIASAGCLLFMDPLLSALGASPEVLPYAKEYLSIILFGAIFQSTGAGLNNFIRTDGHPRTSMLTQLVGAVLNAILCPIFIFGFHWGMAGAAWATVISQTVTFLWVIGYFNSKFTKLRFKLSHMALRGDVVFATLAIGFAPFAMQLASGLLGVIMNRTLLEYGGNLSVSAMGIVVSILNLMIMPMIGINQGAQPIIGYNYGARNMGRVIKTVKISILACTCLTVTGFIIVQLFPSAIIRLFNANDPALIDLGSRCLRWGVLAFPVIGVQIASSNLFQSIGKPLQGGILSLSRQILFLIPLLMLLPRLSGFQGILFAMPLSDFLSASLAAFLVIREIRRLRAV